MPSFAWRSALVAIEVTDALSALICPARVPALIEDREAVAAVVLVRRVLRQRVERARRSVEFGRRGADRSHDVRDRCLERLGEREHIGAAAAFGFALDRLAVRALGGFARLGRDLLLHRQRQAVAARHRVRRLRLAVNARLVLPGHQQAELDGNIGEHGELQADRDRMDDDASEIARSREHPFGRERIQREMVDRDQRGGERDRSPVAQHDERREPDEEIHMAVHLPRIVGHQIDAERRVDHRERAREQPGRCVVPAADDHPGRHDVGGGAHRDDGADMRRSDPPCHDREAGDARPARQHQDPHAAHAELIEFADDHRVPPHPAGGAASATTPSRNDPAIRARSPTKT